MDYRLIYSTEKEYNNMFRVQIYKTPLFVQLGVDRTGKESKNTSEYSIQRSVRRTRSVISDYVLNNDFDMFVTFTFDPKKVNRYDLNTCYTRMQLWLSNQRRKSKSIDKEFKYIVVPEKHKDGAIHFHALIANLPSKLKKTKVIQNNKRVYNLLGYRYGFTNAQYLDSDKQKTTAYLCKYITKDMELISNRRRYWCSKNLLKPVKSNNSFSIMNLNPFINDKNLSFKNDYVEIYDIPKDVVELFK